MKRKLTKIIKKKKIAVSINSIGKIFLKIHLRWGYLLTLFIGAISPNKALVNTLRYDRAMWIFLKN